MTESKAGDPIVCAVCGEEISGSLFSIFMNPELEDPADPWFETIMVCPECYNHIQDRIERFDPTSLLTLFGVNGMENN